jgi:hypothetical protein
MQLIGANGGRSDNSSVANPPEKTENHFFFDETLAPCFRASDKPIAIACFRLVTVFPDPLLRVPRFRSCMALSTLADAFLLYFGMHASLVLHPA